MPSAESVIRAARTCESHPRREADYVCDSCGRALCLTCAIPVRGKILGTECVGVGSAEEDRPTRGRTHGKPFLAAGAGFLLAVLGTVLPWSAPNFSHYTGLFGGWGFSPIAWSLLAAGSATAGAAAWVFVARTASLPSLVRALPIAGVLTAAGAIMFVLWPPFATGPWLGPWITLAGAAVAFVASFRWATIALRPDKAAGS